MVVYNVFSTCVSYKYKAYLCSKSSLVLIIISVITVFFPLIFTYRNHGFWKRTDVYQEQPDISFKYDYVLLVNTNKKDRLILCSNLQQLSSFTEEHNHCPFIKAREEDNNRDGINDILIFNLHIATPEGETINGITLLLFFDYKLTSYCRVHMEAMGVIQHGSAEAGAGLSVMADLSWKQRHPLRPRQLHSRYNTSVIPPTPTFSLPDVLTQYFFRNVSAQFTNMYLTWLTEPASDEMFILQATIVYSEASVLYKPTPWQLLHSGWTQLFPVLFISILVFRSVKDFIFSNQLVYTYKEIPWKKAH